MRVLVVEDEASLREQLKKQLGSRGYSVDVAADGEEGLFYLREYPQDLAVVDIGLPKLSGIELIRQSRKEGQDLPVLILTARGNWQEKVEGLEAGADDYLVKPFHMEELLARLNALLRRSTGHAVPSIEWGPILLNTASQSVALGFVPAEAAKPGLEVEIETYEWNTFLGKVNPGLEGKADMAEMAWMTNDPDTLPYLALRTDASPDKGGFNSGY